MRVFLKIIPIALLLSSTPLLRARAAVYEWVDANGVVHLTDDVDTVPAKYRRHAKRREVVEAPPSSRPRPAAPEEAPSPDRLQAPVAGAHSEQWWRERFSRLRDEAKTLQDALPAKKADLAELRRQRTIFQRGRDRKALNALEAEIAADEARLKALQQQLALLEMQAAREAVPLEWRR